MTRVDPNDLPEDIWFVILLHLSFKEILKFRCVSKLWFSILSNPNFMKKWYELKNLSLPWVLVCYADMKDQDKKLRRFFTIAYPDTQLSSFCQTEFLHKFLSPLGFYVSSSSEKLFLIGSSCDLVLCTTSIYNQITYYVCNQLTKKWVSLPPPPPRENNQVVTGIVCNECCSSSLVSRSYKVIRIPKFAAAAKEFKVETYSSELGEWNIYDVSCPQYVTWDNSLSDNLLTFNGIFYWFQQPNRNILAVRDNECRLINTPDRAMDVNVNYFSECLGESEGFICFARFKKIERTLSVWVLDGDWYMLHKDIGLPDRLDRPVGVDLITEMFHKDIGLPDRLDGPVGVDLITEIEVVGISPVDKNVVILSSEKNIWGYNTKTGLYEQFRHPGKKSVLQYTRTRMQYFYHFIGVKYNKVLVPRY